MGVKRSVRASGMQIKAIKRLWNMFYKSKFQNTDFQNFPLYFLKFPLYNVRGLRGHFPLEFRAHLYVFGISGGRRMGKHTELNLIPTFNFFGTPYCPYILSLQRRMKTDKENMVWKVPRQKYHFIKNVFGRSLFDRVVLVYFQGNLWKVIYV